MYETVPWGKLLTKNKDLPWRFKVSVEQMKAEKAMGVFQQGGLNWRKFTSRMIQSKFKYRIGLIFSFSSFALK